MAKVTKEKKGADWGTLIGFGLGVIVFGFVIISKNLSSDSSSSDGKIKDMTGLKKWAKEETESLCDDWEKAKSYQNEVRRYEEMKRVDGRYFNFSLHTADFVRDNDLPESYINEIDRYIDQELEKCGCCSGY